MVTYPHDPAKAMLRLFALVLLLPNMATAEQLTGVLLNPYSGYVGAIVIKGAAEVQAKDLSACGPGCEFTDFLRKGDCMVVAISRREAAYGYHFGPADDLPNSRAQAKRHCQRYGGTACKVYEPICDR